MNALVKHVFASSVWLALVAGAFPQAPDSDHVVVPFSDPSQPGAVKVRLITGSIQVKGYDGKEVIVDAKRAPDESQRRSHASTPDTAGLKRIPNLSAGLRIEEEGNVISIGVNPPLHQLDIVLQVPSRTNLKLNTINSGEIKAEQVQGEIEVNNIEGGVTLSQVSGAVVAHALNGNVKVTLVRVAPDKPMSFSSLNGDIDVSLPPDVKANLSMNSANGEIYSDFDIKIDTKAVQSKVEESREKGGKYSIKMSRTTRGAINGGGPEIQLKTFNGNIYIRKLK